MGEILETMHEGAPKGVGAAGLALGVRISIGGRETLCQVTETWKTREDAQEGIGSMIAALEGMLRAAEALPRRVRPETVSLPPGDLPPERVWKGLSEQKDTEGLLQAYNGLPEEVRRAVAEHVLAHCNVFSGKGAFFSSRYDTESALLTSR